MTISKVSFVQYTASKSTLSEAIAALRYLAVNERPSGGQEKFNSEDLLRISDELVDFQPIQADTASISVEKKPRTFSPEHVRAMSELEFTHGTSARGSQPADVRETRAALTAAVKDYGLARVDYYRGLVNAGVHTAQLMRVEAALTAFENALLDALDANIAELRVAVVRAGDAGHNDGLNAARAVIQARKEAR